MTGGNGLGELKKSNERTGNVYENKEQASVFPTGLVVRVLSFNLGLRDASRAEQPCALKGL